MGLTLKGATCGKSGIGKTDPNTLAARRWRRALVRHIEPRCVSTCRRRSLAEDPRLTSLWRRRQDPALRVRSTLAPGLRDPRARGAERGIAQRYTIPTHFDAANEQVAVAVLHCLRRSSSDYLPSFLQHSDGDIDTTPLNRMGHARGFSFAAIVADKRKSTAVCMGWTGRSDTVVSESGHVLGVGSAQGDCAQMCSFCIDWLTVTLSYV